MGDSSPPSSPGKRGLFKGKKTLEAQRAEMEARVGKELVELMGHTGEQVQMSGEHAMAAHAKKLGFTLAEYRALSTLQVRVGGRS